MSSQLKVQELRDALEERGLETSGTKAVLVARLEAYEKEKTSKKRDASSIDDAALSQGKKAKCDLNGSSIKEDIDGFSVAELRSALAKRGLSTAGTKKTLHSRLSEALNVDGNKKDDDDNDACSPKPGEKGKSNEDSETQEDIDGFTVAELRSALAERGLSTAGTKKTLHSRLLEALKATKPIDNVKDVDEDDGKECDGKEQEKEEKIVVMTKKGRAVLDNYLPDHIKSRFHVLETDQGIYDAMLNQTNVGDNNNKFYVIQVLESDDGARQYYVYNRWGRVGVRGQDKLFGIVTKESAISEFEAKFFDKTKNHWAQRSNFQPAKSKYTWLERDYSDDSVEASEAKTKSTNKTLSIDKGPKESKLESRLAQFISCICNINMMKQQMMEIGYDANKMPLGKLSKATILKGYETLKQIAAVLDGTTTGSLEQLSSEFYTVIPHDFGFQRMSNFIINTHGKLKKKLEMVEALGEIQLATKLLQEEEEEDDPVYSSYQRLKCHLEPLDHGCEEFAWIKAYLHNTHAKTHAYYELEILQVFKTNREGEEERFKKLNNRMLLWHGSRLTNWTGILSQGLRIAPPEAPVTGYMFGKGVYFADMVSKSANYCCTSTSNPIGVLLLCEVALGEMRELQNADYNAGKLPAGKHSTKGVGTTEPNPKEFKILPDGVIVPMGKPVEKGNRMTLLYNEYIVYDVAQIRMRYVLQVKFKYKN